MRDKSIKTERSPYGFITKERRRIHNIWAGMKQRSTNPSHPLAHRYSKRGITLCEEWVNFVPFYEWAMQNGYEDSLTIDRIDNDKGYSPENCRWVCNTVNHRNSTSVKINEEIAGEIRAESAKGTQGKILAERFGLCKGQISHIINNKHWAPVNQMLGESR